ncbi:MAG: hypothetical protein U0736_16015 [Gemmataceae bacterium]
MSVSDPSLHDPHHGACCSCGRACAAGHADLPRRDFLKLGTLAFAGTALTDLSWKTLAAAEPDEPQPGTRQPLVVKPVLMYEIPQRHPKTSWRSWGGIQTEAEADAEKARIQAELTKIQAEADFPVKFLPLLAVKGPAAVAAATDLASADAIVLYAAGGPQAVIDAVVKAGKPTMIFLRHRSGPVSLWYEIISPRYLHQHTDRLAVKGIDTGDVVVDDPNELVWRMRSLCGLKNVRGGRILAVGGPAGWAHPEAPDLAVKRFGLDIRTVTYKDLGVLIGQARADEKAVRAARSRAAAYLADSGVKLETQKEYVENAFLLDRIFRGLMAKAGTRAMTINNCMSTIMPMAETTACLTLSTLNDAGYLAFCESDFVVIPAGMLLAGISGKPQFLNDPTYPHQGVITLAHCTGPRKMDGKTREPVRLVTHFESDFGAAPKVEMRKGQKVTNIIPDFKAERWSGFVGEILEAPFLPICRSQIEVAYKFPDARLADNMPGFHWMTCYGEYTREVGYALKRIPIAWEDLG